MDVYRKGDKYTFNLSVGQNEPGRNIQLEAFQIGNTGFLKAADGCEGRTAGPFGGDGSDAIQMNAVERSLCRRIFIHRESVRNFGRDKFVPLLSP